MGRELKRVPLDFAWPLNKRWKGYVNPHYEHREYCQDCEGTGYSPFALELRKKWYGLSPFDPSETGSLPFAPSEPIILEFATRNVTSNPGYYGSGDEAIRREAIRYSNLCNGQLCHHLREDDWDALIRDERIEGPVNAHDMNRAFTSGLGHDSLNCHVVIAHRCQIAGEPRDCSSCDGYGDQWPSPEHKRAFEEWERTGPPTGEGWQVWETVSEGSPISPVFADPNDLAEYMARNAKGVNEGVSKESWQKWIEGSGWSVSCYLNTEGSISPIELG